jgi:hypothetical protein
MLETDETRKNNNVMTINISNYDLDTSLSCTERSGRVISGPASYSGVPGFKSQTGGFVIRTGIYLGSLQSVQGNAWTVLHIAPR